ncbi:hypothetical protein BX600DRAFT_455909, partial [Xylariales sp. PMI_506]
MLRSSVQSRVGAQFNVYFLAFSLPSFDFLFTYKKISHKFLFLSVFLLLGSFLDVNSFCNNPQVFVYVIYKLNITITSFS